MSWESPYKILKQKVRELSGLELSKSMGKFKTNIYIPFHCLNYSTIKPPTIGIYLEYVNTVVGAQN